MNKTHKILHTILLIIFAEIGNLLVALCASPLHLPLFLDTIFTVAITFYAGLVPGLIVAALYNPLFAVIMKFLFHQPETFLNVVFIVPGMLIAFTTWIFSRRKESFLYSRNVTFLYLLVISLASAFVSCFASAFMETVVRPFFEQYSMKNSPSFTSTDSLSTAFGNFGFSKYLAALLPRIPITTIDRLVCTFAGFGVYKLYSYIENKRGGRRR